MFTRYIVGGYSAALLLLLLGVGVVRRSSADLRGARQITASILCLLGVLALLAVHPLIPLALSVLGANAVSFAGAIFIYLAVADIQQAKPRLVPWQAGFSAAVLAGMLWSSLLRGSPGGRLFLHNLVMAAIFAMAAALLWRPSDPLLRNPQRAAAIALTGLACCDLAWGVAGLVDPLAPNFQHVDMLHISFSYGALALNCASVAALMWFSLCLHRRDLHLMAETDPLTALLNRRAFEEILQRELPRCDGANRRLGAMLIDVDHFKQVNDSMGHPAGDEVLRRVAAVLRAGTRAADVLCRYGGEEFVVLLRDSGGEESACIAERIRASIAALRDLPGRGKLTVSIGVALCQPGETPGQLLARCDQAMYQAKHGGRNLVMIDRETGPEPVIRT